MQAHAVSTGRCRPGAIAQAESSTKGSHESGSKGCAEGSGAEGSSAKGGSTKGGNIQGSTEGRFTIRCHDMSARGATTELDGQAKATTTAKARAASPAPAGRRADEGECCPTFARRVVE